MTQLVLIDAPTPEAILADAEREHGSFAHRFALCSGGSDSVVLAHRCRDLYDTLVFIDTGTALPGVVEHVRRIADLVERPLLVYGAGVQWRAMILGGRADPARPSLRAFGFPGPGQHGVAYNRLKLRQVERLVRDHKTRRSDRIALLTGVRRGESARRAWNVRNLVRRNGAQVWLAPLAHWTNEEMRDYRDEHALPLSDVSALIHRSGECNCGSFSSPGEREMLAALWPDWFETTIGSLEREAAAIGVPCRWGDRPGKPAAAGELCSDCQLQIKDAG